MMICGISLSLDIVMSLAWCRRELVLTRWLRGTTLPRKPEMAGPGAVAGKTLEIYENRRPGTTKLLQRHKALAEIC